MRRSLHGADATLQAAAFLGTSNTKSDKIQTIYRQQTDIKICKLTYNIQLLIVKKHQFNIYSYDTILKKYLIFPRHTEANDSNILI